MKTVVLILDGLADEPAQVLGGHTPLEAARTPALDRLAARGVTGRFQPTPDGFSPGTDVGGFAVLGVHPVAGGRGRLEALGRGIPLAPERAVYRVTCVRLSGPIDDPRSILFIPPATATFRKVVALVPPLKAEGIDLYPDAEGRHLLAAAGWPELAGTSPYDLAGLPIGLGGALPEMARLTAIQRNMGGLALWPWGGAPLCMGGARSPVSAMVTATGLVRGMARALAMEAPPVAGATGNADTDLSAKCRATRALLARHDVVAVHVEATDMLAHGRDPIGKTRFIERVDRALIGPLADVPSLRLLVTCDHGTSSVSGRHLSGPVPYLLAEPGRAGSCAWNETAAAETPVLDVQGWRGLLGVPVTC